MEQSAPIKTQPRNEIYESLNKELKYQDSLSKNNASLPEELLLIEYYLNEAKTKWVINKQNGPCLDALRKVAAVAVRCFENHGCPGRYLGYSDVRDK